jgi:hypothetical protein
MTALYQIAQTYRADLEALAELDIDDETARDTLEGMQGELQDKLRAVIAYSLELDITATGAAEAAKRMKARADALDKRCAWLRRYALDAMRATGLPEIGTDEWHAKPAKTPGRVIVDDETLIPATYMRTPEPPAPQPDKTAIAAALKAGADVLGARLEAGYRLAIK